MNIKVGTFLPSRGETCFGTLDASDVATWLRKNGYKVIGNYDTGGNGLAVTKCGIAVSTNGYIHKATREQIQSARRAARNPFAWS